MDRFDIWGICISVLQYDVPLQMMCRKTNWYKMPISNTKKSLNVKLNSYLAINRNKLTVNDKEINNKIYWKSFRINLQRALLYVYAGTWVKRKWRYFCTLSMFLLRFVKSFLSHLCFWHSLSIKTLTLFTNGSGDQVFSVIWV